jgi:nicotinamide mononucleotide transporter PnuC
MKFFKEFRKLTKFELTLWICSLIAVTASFLLCPEKDYLSLSASLVGATALIFLAKGLVIGQVLTVLFSLLYGIVSCIFGYYGEMITYVFMSTPAAVFSIISWLRHPYAEGDGEVEVRSRLTPRTMLALIALSTAVTVAFFFILRALDTANLIFSTVSIATSFFASGLTFLRSPYYALAYCSNDIVLILLWVLATVENVAYLPMILCFVVFLLNDVYGFVNWRRMQKEQSKQ